MGHVCFLVDIVLNGPIVDIIMKGSKKGSVNETGLVFQSLFSSSLYYGDMSVASVIT